MKSCIFKGQVRHRRFTPVDHAFSYKLFMMYVDLEELPSLFKRFLFWSFNKRNLAYFDRKDHIGNEAESLDKTIKNIIFDQTGKKHNGPIRLLTHFRYFGFCFNPVSFYYCFNETTDEIDFIVCEVSNTPWNEKHIYVLDSDHADKKNDVQIFEQDKQFHVSPFMPMSMQYRWHFSSPDEELNVHMVNLESDKKSFDATLRLHRISINSVNLARVLTFHPLMTLKVVTMIYFQALRLWLKKVPFYPHPNRERVTGESKL